MMVLVDSSVWVDHFRNGNSHLQALLSSGQVLCHPYVILELACGTPPHRREVLEHLGNLPCATVATHTELLTFIQAHKIYGRGCGMVDVALLAGTILSPAVRLWTADKRLHALAAEFNCAFPAPLY